MNGPVCRECGCDFFVHMPHCQSQIGGAKPLGPGWSKHPPESWPDLPPLCLPPTPEDTQEGGTQ
jgi:hypothetical protein